MWCSIIIFHSLQKWCSSSLYRYRFCRLGFLPPSLRRFAPPRFHLRSFFTHFHASIWGFLFLLHSVHSVVSFCFLLIFLLFLPLLLHLLRTAEYSARSRFQFSAYLRFLSQWVLLCFFLSLENFPYRLIVYSFYFGASFATSNKIKIIRIHKTIRMRI